jgi:predicted solute-binding protein
LLFFRENLPSIERAAFLPPKSQYQLLANLVLEEFYEMELDWTPLKEMNSLDSVLSMFPACLLEGDKALENYFKVDSKLDILEEWHVNTELNYVHQLIAINREADNTGFLESLHLAREIGMRNLMNIAKKYADDKGGSWDFYFDLLNENFQFFPTEETWDSLRQYFEYLFYYRLIDFIPDIHFS